MAELTNLESKLGEVIGLSKAAQEASRRISKLVDEKLLAAALNRMRTEASEAEKRATALAGRIKGKKTAILGEARETKSKASDMMSIYLDDGSDGLDGFEFLTMAEAGEVGHWKVLLQMAKHAGNKEIIALAEWQVPIQERHLKDAESGCLTIAAEEDPDGAAS
jgi:hypothetical protein